MNILFRSEFKANHGEWVKIVKPNLGPGIRERVHEAIASEDGPMEDFHVLKIEFKSAHSALIKVTHGIPLHQRRILYHHMHTETTNCSMCLRGKTTN